MTFLIIQFLHWFGDFRCQTRYMADNKSKSWQALAAHVSVYSLMMLTGVFCWYAGRLLAGMPSTGIAVAIVEFVLVNAALHAATDRVTSRMTSRRWIAAQTADLPMDKAAYVKSFFDVIGFDQFIHQACLWITARYILP